MRQMLIRILLGFLREISMLNFSVSAIALLFFTSNKVIAASTDMSRREFDRLVAGGLEHLWDFSYLGKHPLSQLSIVKQRLPQELHHSHLDAGRAVSEILRDAIEALKPIEGQKNFSREKHYYTILVKAYVESIPNKTIAKSINMGERTLYRYSIKAIQASAQVLWDWDAGFMNNDRQPGGNQISVL